PQIDPKTLCPYCDRLLPDNPSDVLEQLLGETFRRTYRDVRPDNPLGRKGPITAFAAVCQRHMLESVELPRAVANGWPMSIDWYDVEDRVLSMKGDLKRILRDPGRPINYSNGEAVLTGQEAGMNGPRMRCMFWISLLKELELNGSRRVNGVEGQFATFEKTQPGYYGELGSAVMHRTLYRMFQPTTKNCGHTHPLTLRDFIARILVPEVGMRLIIEDLGLDLQNPGHREDAVAVMRASASYGVAMFPDDDAADNLSDSSSDEDEDGD
ncbi:RTC4-like domain-containing protein, partial [Mycena galericulata]